MKNGGERREREKVLCDKNERRQARKKTRKDQKSGKKNQTMESGMEEQAGKMLGKIRKATPLSLAGYCLHRLENHFCRMYFRLFKDRALTECASCFFSFFFSNQDIY